MHSPGPELESELQTGFGLVQHTPSQHCPPQPGPGWPFGTSWVPQTPLIQMGSTHEPPWHWVSHIPQWLGSVLRSVQAPAQQTSLPGQAPPGLVLSGAGGVPHTP